MFVSRISAFTIAILSCIVVGAILRFVQLGSIPPGLNRDEAALGYNAFSILKTGKDEWGVPFPVVYKSFGDYKLAGYIVALLPSIATFGLNEVAVRLPSAIAGVALIGCAAYLAYIFTDSKRVSFVTAAFQAIAPWALHYSKVAFEANLALVLFIGGLSLVLHEAPNCTKKSLLGILLIFASLLTYNAPLILLPLILVVLILWEKRLVFAAVLIGVTAIVAFFLVYPATKGKQGITIFSDEGITTALASGRSRATSLAQHFFYARPVYYFGVIVKNYAASFDPIFLVVRGGQNPWHQAPGEGHLSWSLYILALLGILVGWNMVRKKDRLIVYGLLAASPLPSAITSDAPHATRMLLFLFMMGLFASLGFVWIMRKSKVVVGLVGLALCVEFVLYLYTYFMVFPQHPQLPWLKGMREAVQQAESNRKQNQTISVLGDERYMYVYALFYTQFDPREYQATVLYYPNDNLGLPRIKQFGHYQFIPDNGEPSKDSSVIYQDSAGNMRNIGM